MNILRFFSEFLGRILNRTVVVSGDSDNIAGLAVALNFSLYWAKATGRRVLFIYRPIYFPCIFNRIKIHSIKKRHALFELTSPLIDSSPSLLARHIVGNLVGILCFCTFLVDLLKYKVRIYDQIVNYPRYIFGPNNLFDLDFVCKTNRVQKSSILTHDYNIDLPPKKNSKCKSDALKLGIVGKKFVCLHIRTRHYKGTPDKENDGFRNASPESYIPAVRYLISKGLTVVRLGDRVENLLPSIEGYVDYANSELKSEDMDIYLIKNCFFYLGTNSGIYDLAALLRVPMLTVNVTEMLAAKPFNRLDVMIYKRIKRVGTAAPIAMKEYLNLREPVSLGDFEFIDNSPDDLIESINQMLANLSDGFQENDKIDDQFEADLKAAAKRWASLIFSRDSGPTYRNAKDESDRIRSYQHFDGKIGREFVRKYY